MESKGSILIIDDDKEFQTLACLILGGQGYDIVGAENGLDALEFLSTHTPQLIVLDIRMPRMNGVDFLKAYHEMVASPAPIIMVSAANLPELLAASTVFLMKPFTPAALRTAVADCLP